MASGKWNWFCYKWIDEAQNPSGCIFLLLDKMSDYLNRAQPTIKGWSPVVLSGYKQRDICINKHQIHIFSPALS